MWWELDCGESPASQVDSSQERWDLAGPSRTDRMLQGQKDLCRPHASSRGWSSSESVQAPMWEHQNHDSGSPHAIGSRELYRFLAWPTSILRSLRRSEYEGRLIAMGNSRNRRGIVVSALGNVNEH